MAPSIHQGSPETRQVKRTGRIEAGLNAEQKQRIEYAASLKGTSTSDFIVASADEAAKRMIQEHQTWTLSAQESLEFVKTILNPPAPNERMKAAMKRYTERGGA